MDEAKSHSLTPLINDDINRHALSPVLLVLLEVSPSRSDAHHDPASGCKDQRQRPLNFSCTDKACKRAGHIANGLELIRLSPSSIFSLSSVQATSKTRSPELAVKLVPCF